MFPCRQRQSIGWRLHLVKKCWSGVLERSAHRSKTAARLCRCELQRRFLRRSPSLRAVKPTPAVRRSFAGQTMREMLPEEPPRCHFQADDTITRRMVFPHIAGAAVFGRMPERQDGRLHDRACRSPRASQWPCGPNLPHRDPAAQTAGTIQDR